MRHTAIARRSRATAGRPLLPLALLLAVSGAFAQQVADKPLGHWTFDETEGPAVPDLTGRGHEGAILNDGRGVERVPGRVGGALRFTGGDPAQRNLAGGVALPGFGETDWSQGLTLEVWVRFDAMDRPQTYEILSTTKDDRGPGWRLMLTWLSLCLRSGEGGEGQTWGVGSNSSETAVKTDEWYHLAGTYAAGTYRVYLDGELVAEARDAKPVTPGDPTISLGAYRGGYAYGLNGTVDEVRVFGYARSPKQIMMAAKLGE